ncbi:uncharacterized protein LOC121861458 [Homarus americanus]|uniref:Uncharacterized protein n=1 Tax=Homarus americanus TaxID=6706 RepID=A0A8J5NE53_HOMAM|nr:uncharacterized protein LOC121861458 [Homarus americanus]KAG7177609.1 hypothetical protein Hamer_G008253 [Homarus americanus]
MWRRGQSSLVLVTAAMLAVRVLGETLDTRKRMVGVPQTLEDVILTNFIETLIDLGDGRRMDLQSVSTSESLNVQGSTASISVQLSKVWIENLANVTRVTAGNLDEDTMLLYEQILFSSLVLRATYDITFPAVSIAPQETARGVLRMVASPTRVNMTFHLDADFLPDDIVSWEAEILGSQFESITGLTGKTYGEGFRNVLYDVTRNYIIATINAEVKEIFESILDEIAFDSK